MAASVDDLAQRVSAALAPVEAVRVAYLFGSRAAGRARPQSDLDLAVRFDAGLDGRGRELARRAVVARLTDALGALGEKTDVVDLDLADSAVGFRAIRDGRCVLARDRAERVLLEARVARRYDDDGPRRELFRRAAIRVARDLAETSRGRS